LNKNNCTLRIREIDKEYEVTIKKPIHNIPEMVHSEDQSARFEYKKIISNNKLKNAESFILEHFENIKNIEELNSCLIIKNARESINLNKGDINFEVVFDKVTYSNPEGKEANDYQVEIELKSDYIHRVNLKILTDDLESQISGLKSTKISKYQRGLQLLYEKN
jgi:inorganic triphosphatase YgiF